MPLVTGSRKSSLHLIGIGLPKLLAPSTNGFLADLDAALGQDFFDIPIAQAEAEVEPDCVTDYGRGKAMAGVGDG